MNRLSLEDVPPGIVCFRLVFGALNSEMRKFTTKTRDFFFSAGPALILHEHPLTVSFSTVNLAKSVLVSSKHFRSPSRTHRIFISPMLSPQQQQKMEDLVSKFKLLRKKISERSYDFRVYQCGLAVKIVSANGNKVFYPAGSKTAPYDFITEHKASLRT